MAVILRPGEALPSCDPALGELYAAWLAIRPGPDRLPGRQHFDPLAVPRLLPWLWLLDVQRAPLRFRYRLIGTEQVQSMGRDLTGQWLDECHPSFRSHTYYGQFVAAVEQGCVAIRRGPPSFRIEAGHKWVERLLLPLARDGATVDMLLAITVYFGGGGQRVTSTRRGAP